MTQNERFKEVRKKLKFTQKEYAEELGISQSHLSNIETGNDNPSLTLIKFVCLKYGIREEWLISGEGDPSILSESFSVEEDEGIITKYKSMKKLFEDSFFKETGENLLSLEESYARFVSIVSACHLNEINKKDFLNEIDQFFDLFEKLVFHTSVLNISVSKKDYKGIYYHKLEVDDKINEMNKCIKNALNCYIRQFKYDDDVIFKI